MRARLAIAYARREVILREVALRNKPTQMLAISSKGTVPVLQLPDGSVLDESLDIMLWALQNNDPDELLGADALSTQNMTLIDKNDDEFKHWLDRYKYADRYPEQTAAYYRAKAEVFLQSLEHRLCSNLYLCDRKPRLVDIAIMPFVRQFAAVDRDWFEAAHYPHVQRWLADWLANSIFQSVMKKYAPWQDGLPTVLLLGSKGV